MIYICLPSNTFICGNKSATAKSKSTQLLHLFTPQNGQTISQFQSNKFQFIVNHKLVTFLHFSKFTYQNLEKITTTKHSWALLYQNYSAPRYFAEVKKSFVPIFLNQEIRLGTLASGKLLELQFNTLKQKKITH